MLTLPLLIVTEATALTQTQSLLQTEIPALTETRAV